MSSRQVRFMSFVVLLAAALALTGLLAPGAGAQVFTATFIANPTDAVKNQVITTVPLNPGAPKVKVQVSATETSVAGLLVTLQLVEGPGFATTANLSGNVATTDGSGVATFPDLKIGDPNEATFTDYEFEAIVAGDVPTSEPATGTAFASEGAFSNPFDIWDAGCRGSGCSVAIRNGLDVYRTTQNVRLTASDLSASTLPGLQCPNQPLVVFPGDVFVHETNGTGVVGLTNHVTFADLNGGGGGGAAALGVADDDPDSGPRIKWCVGTKTRAPWLRNGAPFTRRDTNGDGTLDLYVGIAPKCPATAPRSYAPCIVSRVRDGHGGFFIRGWLPGGDPPRRT
jgi:hypothetical protein